MRPRYSSPAHESSIIVDRHLEPGPHWVVVSVYTKAKHRGQGWASRLMTQVVADADKEGVALYLTVMPEPRLDDELGLGHGELVAWYERRGWVDLSPARGSWMCRAPRGEP